MADHIPTRAEDADTLRMICPNCGTGFTISGASPRVDKGKLTRARLDEAERLLREVVPAEAWLSSTRTADGELTLPERIKEFLGDPDA